jgi:hypothetical protein
MADMEKHCCEEMSKAVNYRCVQHPDPFDCPDNLIQYSAKLREYGIIVHDGGSSTCSIHFCPWCGARLPDSLRDRWFEEMDRLGIDPWKGEIPEAFQSSAWWEDQSA